LSNSRAGWSAPYTCPILAGDSIEAVGTRQLLPFI